MVVITSSVAKICFVVAEITFKVVIVTYSVVKISFVVAVVTSPVVKFTFEKWHQRL